MGKTDGGSEEEVYVNFETRIFIFPVPVSLEIAFFLCILLHQDLASPS